MARKSVELGVSELIKAMPLLKRINSLTSRLIIRHLHLVLEWNSYWKLFGYICLALRPPPGGGLLNLIRPTAA